jgi:hypothetical protein
MYCLLRRGSKITRLLCRLLVGGRLLSLAHWCPLAIACSLVAACCRLLNWLPLAGACSCSCRCPRHCCTHRPPC